MHPFSRCFALLASVLFAALPAPASGEAPPAAGETAPAAGEKMTEGLRAALEKLELPGVTINVDEWAVDVAAKVCLQSGLLELIACTKDSKEHESIVMVEAKPSHIHTALLLLGAKPGNPAMRRIIDEEGMRFIDIPPRGGEIDVFLVLGDETRTEHPISDFIQRADRYDAFPHEQEGEGEGEAEDRAFPTHTFLFVGSILHGQGDGPRRYLCDQSGHVISLATFGDEVLCLPGIHADLNSELMWEINTTKLPPLDTKVTLRLRPRREAPPPDEASPPVETPDDSADGGGGS